MRAVLFDLDGVLVDSYQVWFHVMNAVARDLGFPAISTERFAQSWGQSVEADVQSFYPTSKPDEVTADYERRFPDYVAHLRVHPRAREVLSTLRGKGVRVAVITNTPAPVARAIVERGALQVDALVSATDVARPKPAPEIVVKACELLGVEPSQAIVVGDSRYDREAAASAGALFAGLATDGDCRLKDLAEILDLWLLRAPSGS